MPIQDEDGFELIDFDPHMQRSIWAYYDGEKTIIKTTYATDDTIEENTHMRNTARPDWAGDYHRIASIPLNIAHDSGFVDAMTQRDDAFMKRFLNDGDNAAWRTKSGTV
jgi:hypothetical protein